MVKVIDETGEIVDGELRQFGKVTAAIVDGRILLPGAFTVLTAAQAGKIEAAIERSGSGQSEATRVESRRI